MSLMTWTAEQHGTDVDFADNEHQKVFKNLNILYDLKMEEAGNDEIVEQLDSLLVIVTEHFIHEENAMLEKDFIGYERHKLEHDQLINTCTLLDIKIKAGELELTERLCQLIKSWFESHIPEYDKAYSQALNG
jgi:hemerythrin